MLMLKIYSILKISAQLFALSFLDLLKDEYLA